MALAGYGQRVAGIDPILLSWGHLLGALYFENQLLESGDSLS